MAVTVTTAVADFDESATAAAVRVTFRSLAGAFGGAE
jgi:hypothetical protein